MKRIIGWLVGAVGLVALGVWIFLIVFEDPHVAQGRALFAKYCVGCHGLKGRGNGFNARYLDPYPPDLTDRFEPYMAEASNEQIFSAIDTGVAGVAPPIEGGREHVHKHDEGEEDEAIGSPLMPYFGFTLTDEEIWSLVAYIRTLHKNDAPPVEFEKYDEAGRRRPPAIQKIEFPSVDSHEGQELIAEGKKLFEDRYACTACHEVNGVGGKLGPALDRAGFRLNHEWVYRWIIDSRGIKLDTLMPSFALPDQEARAITLYLTTLKARPQEASTEKNKESEPKG